MAIVFEVEAGTGSTTATSYLSVEDLDQILEDNGFTITLTTDAQKEAALNRYTKNLDAYRNWTGSRKNALQALEFPRSNCYYTDGNLVDNASVPSCIKLALAYMVYYANSGTDVTPVSNGEVQTISNAVSGAVSQSITYFRSGTISPIITEIDNVLKRLSGSRQSMNLRLERA